jgi:hypothetical protein
VRGGVSAVHVTFVREWHKDAGSPWFAVHRVYATARGLGIKPLHGHFQGRRGEPGALMLATMGT